MATQTKDLWRLVKYRPEVDPDDLAAAIQDELDREPLDYRTRLLIRDSMDGLRHYWGDGRFEGWLHQSAGRARLEGIAVEPFERPGFPSMAKRLVKKTSPEQICSYLQELGSQLDRPVDLALAGAAAFILPGHYSRSTKNINFIGEMPVEIRALQALLHRLHNRYHLSLAHFERCYLPTGWEQRLNSLGLFGQLQVYLLEIYDVFLSKLFSPRDKDRDDLRFLAPQLDQGTLRRRLQQTTASLLAAPDLRRHAELNWYIVLGESLPI
jgi:hypothetical protein